MKRVVFIFLCLFWSAACSDLEDPDSVPTDQMLKVTADFTAIPSGGSGRTRVTARIPEEAGIVDVTFSSTAGVFVQANPNTKFTAKQLADSLVGNYRYANVTLISDATIGTVYLTAEAKSVRARTIIQFN